MAFPVVESVTPSNFANATSHLVAMPATVNVGDLLIALIATDGVASVTTPANWNSLHSSATAANRLGSYYKIAVGDEDGTTVDFVTSATETMAAQVYRISNWHGTTPPEIGAPASAGSGDPDPPSLIPSWGAADTLWLAEYGSDAVSTATAYPTDYTDGITASAGGAGQCSIGSARRNLNATSDNPGTFTVTDNTKAWVAQTIAIQPAAGGAAAADPYPYVGGGYYPTEG